MRPGPTTRRVLDRDDWIVIRSDRTGTALKVCDCLTTRRAARRFRGFIRLRFNQRQDLASPPCRRPWDECGQPDAFAGGKERRDHGGLGAIDGGRRVLGVGQALEEPGDGDVQE